MFILVDSNEQATNPKVLSRMQRVFPNLQITQLPFGDVNIVLDDGNILAVERKMPGDFLGSIGDGRVFRQVEAMSNGAKWCVIIIEGTFEFTQNDMVRIGLETTNWKGSSVRGAMMAIQWSGCPIVFTYPDNYPYVIADMIEFCNKPDIHRQSLGRKRIVTFPPIELKEEIVSAFPGIGLKRAKALFEFAGSQHDGISTLAEALCWVSSFPKIASKSRPEGWGDKTVTNFRGALGLRDDEYIDIKEEKKGTKKNGKSKSK